MAQKETITEELDGRRLTVSDGNDAGVVGNERLTAWAGAALLILLAAEVATVPVVHTFIAVHIFVGVLLMGPLVVKLAAVGWRFLRYYRHHAAYRRKGPPRPLQRLLAPLLLGSTLVLLGSGMALVAVTPGTESVIQGVHKASFVVWVGLLAIHVLAYVGRLPALVGSDWRPEGAAPVPGRGVRIAVNLGAVILGLIGAVLVMPAFNAWTS